MSSQQQLPEGMHWCMNRNCDQYINQPGSFCPKHAQEAAALQQQAVPSAQPAPPQQQQQQAPAAKPNPYAPAPGVAGGAYAPAPGVAGGGNNMHQGGGGGGGGGGAVPCVNAFAGCACDSFDGSPNSACSRSCRPGNTCHQKFHTFRASPHQQQQQQNSNTSPQGYASGSPAGFATGSPHLGTHGISHTGELNMNDGGDGDGEDSSSSSSSSSSSGKILTVPKIPWWVNLHFKSESEELQKKDGITNCPSCKTGFGLTTWRRWCELCGIIYCDTCAPATVEVGDDKHRACNKCRRRLLSKLPKKFPKPCKASGCPCDAMTPNDYDFFKSEGYCCRDCRKGDTCKKRIHTCPIGAPQSKAEEMAIKHGSSGHPMAEYPCKHVDEYIQDILMPRIKSKGREEFERVTAAVFYPFDVRHPPPRLDGESVIRVQKQRDHRGGELYKQGMPPAQIDALLDQECPWPPRAPYSGIESRIDILDVDCLERAQELHKTGKYKNIAVMNLANENAVGGAFSQVVGAQEEYLFRNCTIGLSLWRHRSAHTEEVLHRKWEWGSNLVGPVPRDQRQQWYPFPPYATIYNDNVEVFAIQDEMLKEKERFKISGLTVAAPDLRPKSNGGRHVRLDMDLLMNKLRSCFYACIKNDVDAVVLGAMGCGVFLCPPEDVAQCFRAAFEEMLGTYSAAEFPLKKIDFAIFKSTSKVDTFTRILKPNAGVSGNANNNPSPTSVASGGSSGSGNMNNQAGNIPSPAAQNQQQQPQQNQQQQGGGNAPVQNQFHTPATF